jgi:hypothetical protein
MVWVAVGRGAGRRRERHVIGTDVTATEVRPGSPRLEGVNLALRCM